MNAPTLDRLADTHFSSLSQADIEAIDNDLYALYGIGFGYEGFEDWEITIHALNGSGSSDAYMRWPIPGLQTVRQVHALAESLKSAATAPVDSMTR